MSSEEATIEVFVEIPKGSRNKYEYDKKRKVIVFDRMLYSAVHYPSDYGFIPKTLSLDGDPLDALVLMWEPSFPGCLIKARPVAVFLMEDDKGVDEKILCVPLGDPNRGHIRELKDVPPHLLKEIEHFFAVYKDLEQKTVKIDGWRDRDEALRVIEECRQRHIDQKAGD